MALLERERARAGSPERVLEALSATLRLRLRRAELPRRAGGALAVLQLRGAAPDLAFAGERPAAAAAEALDYLRRALLWA